MSFPTTDLPLRCCKTVVALFPRHDIGQTLEAGPAW